MSAVAIMPYNLFSCKSNGLNYTDACYLIEAGPDDQVYRGFNAYCSVSISVPVLRAAGRGLRADALSLDEAVMQGFRVDYNVPHERLCSECSRLGGQCRFDSELGQPICVCGDGTCPFALTLPPESSPNATRPFQAAAGNNSSKLGMNIGFYTGSAVLVGIGLGWLIFYCRQRRKHVLQRRVSQAASEEITTPSTNFSKSYNLSFTPANSDLIGHSAYFGAQIFSYAELEEATDNFNRSRILGDGGYGVVYYGVLSDGRVIAVKRLHKNNFKCVEQFMNEVEILTLLRHENLVTLYGCTSKRSHELLLVYEYVPNGTVADHLHRKRAKPGLLSWPVRLSIAIETADALDYLHKSDIIHRDVKTNNILLDNDFHVKVADFGLSRLFPTDVSHVSTAPQGTLGYVDPEYYQCYQLTEKSDVYSFGVVLVELISSLQAVDTNRHRHDINLANMAIDKIQNHAFHELVDSSLGFETDSSVRRMATLVAELAFRCLQRERDMRPSMEEVLEALRGIQNEELNGQNVEIDDILPGGDAGAVKGSIPSPLLDTLATEKWITGSEPNSSW
ncbi:probable serine/threonine-protein kinase at1g18390 [Phtheirospermum japonicum]|uniref:Probable serine/threonine-protein kinase at1g18390 n=1 Tax=Phtheirospermum japonicum TaxID=374723 RepID=A0A830C8D4_9LAMI|nr:probable serine/threonine-protein kinase at1g18390 [Phtheirospermum japonicum]